MSTPRVTAPPETQERLLELQSIDDELARIGAHERRLRQATDVRSAEDARADLRRGLAIARGRRDDFRRELSRVESDVTLVEQRLERDRSRLAVTSSPRDAAGLEAEVGSLLRRRATLEDAELEVMQQLEDGDTEVEGLERQVADADTRIAALVGDRDEALAGLLRDGSAATARRTELAAALPGDLVAVYDRQRIRYGIGAALLRGGVSGGSNMALTGADLAAVRAAAPDEIVLDPESGCILVRTSESGLAARVSEGGS